MHFFALGNKFYNCLGFRCRLRCDCDFEITRMHNETATGIIEMIIVNSTKYIKYARVRTIIHVWKMLLILLFINQQSNIMNKQLLKSLSNIGKDNF